MLGDFIFTSVRSSLVTTTSYVAGTVLSKSNFDPANKNQLILYVGITLGSLTSVQVKVEFSNDGSTYYQETASAISTGTSTETLLEHSFTASGNYRIAIPIKDAYIKVSTKGTGTVTGSLVQIGAVLGTV